MKKRKVEVVEEAPSHDNTKLVEAKLLHAYDVQPTTGRLCWEAFFSCQRCPVLRSQLLMALMAGTQLEVNRLPHKMLLDVVLIATASRQFHDAEIVDDYEELLRRTEEEWQRPDWTCRVFDSIHANWAGAIVRHGEREFPLHDEKYIPEMVGWYLAQEVPVYFKREFKEAA